MIDSPWEKIGGAAKTISHTRYHCFKIFKDDGTEASGYDTDIKAKNLLADAKGYTKAIRYGVVLTDENKNTARRVADEKLKKQE